MIWRTGCQATAGLLICLTLVGCNRQDSGPSPEELIRRQQLRESKQLSKARSMEERLAAVEDYLSNGNLVDAREQIRPLLISHPQNHDVIVLSARCEAESGDAMAAAKILELLDENDVEAYSEGLWLAANWLIEANQFDEAQRKLERILELQGDVTRVHRKLALILNNQGRRIETAKHLQALARSGEIREMELFAMNCYSIPFIDDSMPKPDFGDQLTPAALAEAKIFRVDEKMDQARNLTERLSRAFPRSTQIWAFLGRVHEDFQDDESLMRWVKSVPDGIEREPEYWNTLGMWLQRQGRHREAIRCLAETVTRDPTDRIAYSVLGRSLQSLGQREAAKRVMDRAELLAETSWISKELGNRAGTPEELDRMANFLDQLHRPWEAIGWRKVALKTHGGTKDQLAALQARRQSMLADAKDQPQPKHFLTCGIDPAQWPLPSIEAIGTADQTASRSKPDRSSVELPIALRDVAADVGLVFQYDNGDDTNDDQQWLHQLTGGGIGVIDLDLDGYCDLYFTQGGGPAFQADGSKPNRLFRNLGGQRLVDVTIHAQCGDLGYGQGVAVADINQDGFRDLVVANIGPNLIYLNNGDGTFARNALPLSGNDGSWTTSIACGDISGDHLPEILEVNYVDDPSVLTTPCTTQERDSCRPLLFRPAADHTWRVGSDMAISSWDGCAEMDLKPSYGFAAVIANFDENVGNEIFIANDGKQNHFWVSQPDGEAANRTLSESARIYGCGAGWLGQLPGCMGIAFGDFDRNGRFDVHVTNYWNQPADLYLQNSSGLFSNATVSRGLSRHSLQTVAWGTQAVDLDRDGWLDLAVLNGHVQDFSDGGQPFKMRAQLFRGAVEGFRLVEPVSDGYWKKPTLGRTMASLDWNSDTRPDLVANHLDAPVALLENQSEVGNSLQLELVGTSSERDAIGATVTVTCGDQVWTAWVVGGHGFLCSNEQVLDFGVGDAEAVDRVEVLWPTGDTQQFDRLTVGNRYLIIQGDEEAYRR